MKPNKLFDEYEEVSKGVWKKKKKSKGKVAKRKDVQAGLQHKKARPFKEKKVEKLCEIGMSQIKGYVRRTKGDSWLFKLPETKLSDSKRKRKAYLEGYYQYKDEVREKFHKENISYLDIHSISLGFIIQMPDSWTKKKKEQYDGTLHQQKPDLDNLVKAVKDAVMKEDSHIAYYPKMYKLWGRENKIIVYK